jgi:putative ABC transport system permease protein
MLQNFIKIALRTLGKNKAYTFLNVIGLSLGITSAILIFIFINFNFSFDDFHADRERIFRIVMKSDNNGSQTINAGTPYPVGNLLQNELPELEAITSISYSNSGQFIVNNNQSYTSKYHESSGIVFLEPSFFEMFDFPFKIGTPEGSLSEPNNVVLSESQAKKYFNGDINAALGQIIRFNNTLDLKVSGIVEDFPENTDFPFTTIISYASLKNYLNDQVIESFTNINSNAQVFLKTTGSTSAVDLEGKINFIIGKHYDEDIRKSRTHYLQPLKDIHWDVQLGNFRFRTIQKQTIFALSAISLILILTACINFINLSTAQAFKRSKEIGIRKVLGSSKALIANQFLSETFIIALFSILFSLGLVELFLPVLSSVLDLPLKFNLLSDWRIGGFLIGVLFFVSVTSGAYPSFVLAGFKPVSALKNDIKASNTGGIFFRRALVVAQFVISMILVISTIVIFHQMDFFMNKELGFNKDAIIVAQVPEQGKEKLGLFEQKIREHSSIRNIAYSSMPASAQDRWISNVRQPEKPDENNYMDFKIVDHNYFDTYEMKFLAGGGISKSDTIKNIVVNEAFLAKMNIDNPLDAINKTFIIWKQEVPIVGVVKDFHFATLREGIGPAVMFSNISNFDNINIKLATGASENVKSSIQHIEKVFNEIFPEYVFTYEFLDKNIEGFYAEERRISQVVQIFSLMAILIGCLGLYGLISFMAVQKTKEIGVRKVLGASIQNIVLIFAYEFIKLISIAFAIAAPVSYYVMNKWLQDFTFRIDIGWQVFTTAILGIVIISFTTIGFRSVKAALADPIKSLKSE